MKDSLFYQPHFTPIPSEKQLLLPLDVECMVDQEDPVRWVDAYVNTLSDHATIHRFKDRFQSHLPGVLHAFTLYLQRMGLITSEYVMIDGTKIEAASNRYIFVWQRSPWAT